MLPALLLIQVAIRAQTQPKTPYRGQPTLAEVTRLRKISDESRKLPNFQPTTEAVAQTVFNIGLGYCEGDHVKEVSYVIGNSTNNEGSIRLGDAQRFKVTQIDAQTITLHVAVMPRITEAALLAENPTYTNLLENHGKTVDIRLPRHKNGGAACILGKIREYDDDPSPIVLLEQVTRDRSFNIAYDLNKIWWAIPSVIHDPEYPLRIGPSDFEGVVKVKDQ